VASCSEWQGDGTVGEHDDGSGKAATAPPGAMDEPIQVNASLVGKLPKAARQR
jgi:hypothetical protein